MNTGIETKKCTICSGGFEITDADMSFYERASPTFNDKKYLIPPPKLCPSCRRIRRMTFRNEGKLYKRKCALTQKDIVTIYSEDKNIIVYDNEVWYSHDIVPEKGESIKITSGFFQVFQKLMTQVPFQASYVTGNSQNSQYGNHTGEMKNCYLVFASRSSEDVLFGAHLNDVHDTLDAEGCLSVRESYQLIASESCHRVFYSMNCSNCNFSSYLFDCQNCEYCFLCYNLRNKKYYIENREYSPEEYHKKVKELEHQSYQSTWQRLRDMLPKAIKRNLHQIGCENSLGDTIKNTQNCFEVYFIAQAKDCKYLENGALGSYDSYDGYGVGADMKLSYEVVDTGANSTQVSFTTVCHNCNYTFYSFNCFHSHHLFGCIGLRNKEYCILNKQYTKEEYEKIVPQIIEHMEKLGEWGEFFPSSISPFGYNETVAMEYYPIKAPQPNLLPRGEGVKGIIEDNQFIPLPLGETGGGIFNWSDYESPFPKVEKIIPASKLPKSIADIPDDILNWAVECELSKKPFRIIKQELEFYRKFDLPLPKTHPELRHIERMELKNPRKLFERKCSKCAENMKTSYPNEAQDVIYCQNCYDSTFI